MKTYGAWREVRGRQIGCSLAREKPKKIHNPLFYVAGHIVHVCTEWARAPTRSRVCVYMDTRVAATLFIWLVCTYIRACMYYVQISGACVRVCLHTTFPLMYTGIWVSVFLESGFSSLDFGVPATIFLDFLQKPVTTFSCFENFSLFRCQGQPPRWLPHRLFFVCPLIFLSLHSPTHPAPSPLPFSVFFFRLSLSTSFFSLSLSLFYFSPVVCFRLLVCVLDESICLENTWPWVVETIRLERMDRNAIPLPRNFPATTGKCPERASLMD